MGVEGPQREECRWRRREGKGGEGRGKGGREGGG
jgi:hypothetical protein